MAEETMNEIIGVSDFEPAMSPPKRMALEKLIAGESIRTAAAAAGVNRSTLFRWLKDDDLFRTSYQAMQSEIMRSARSRLLLLTDAAVTAVSTAVIRGDARIALTVLNRQGMLQPIDPTD